eukprot:286245_1
MSTTIETRLTKVLGIKYPIILAGMGKVSSPKLAAAVCNAGGCGVLGAGGVSARILKLQIKAFKSQLKDPTLPFGVDFLFPKKSIFGVPWNHENPKFRKELDKRITVLIESNCKMLCCAVGIPPSFVIDRLHKNNILYMAMVGHPKHVKYALDAGCDIICANGAECGGHCGTIPTSLLLPKCVDICKGYKSPIYPSEDVFVIGAGGIYDGRGLIMALSYGCDGIWMGTRFVCCNESGAPMEHKMDIIRSSYDDTVRTRIYSGKPARFIMNKDIDKWENKQSKKKDELLKKGIVPMPYPTINPRPHISGMVCGAIEDILSAKEIIDNIMKQAVQIIQSNGRRLKNIKAKL